MRQLLAGMSPHTGVSQVPRALSVGLHLSSFLTFSKRISARTGLNTPHSQHLAMTLAGVGGAVVGIRTMYYFLKMPLELAIGTSSATVIITTFFSVASYILSGMGRADLPEWSLGFVDFQRGNPLIMGTFLLARVGAYVSFRTHPYRLRILFALFIISLSIHLLVQ